MAIPNLKAYKRTSANLQVHLPEIHDLKVAKVSLIANTSKRSEQATGASSFVAKFLLQVCALRKSRLNLKPRSLWHWKDSLHKWNLVEVVAVVMPITLGSSCAIKYAVEDVEDVK